MSEMQSGIGDGTKTAAIFAREMLTRAVAALDDGVPIERLVRGMDRAVQTALGTLESEAKPVIGNQLRQLGQTAAQDPAMGAALEEAFDRVGRKIRKPRQPPDSISAGAGHRTRTDLSVRRTSSPVRMTIRARIY